MTASAARLLTHWAPHHPVDHAELVEEPERRAPTPAGDSEVEEIQLIGLIFVRHIDGNLIFKAV